MTYTPLTLALLASLLTDADEPRRELLLAEFMEGYSHSAQDAMEREALCLDEPSLVGDARWDALIAGLAEYLADRDGFEVGGWVNQPERSSAQVWYFLDLPSARLSADLDTPTAFRRRGVMIRPLELIRV